MKKITRLLLSLSLMSTLFIACSEDDNNDGNGSGTSVGRLVVAGETYDLSNGMLEYYGSWNASGEPYNMDIILYSDGITISEVDGESLPSGKGHFMYFEVLTDTEESLPEGTYTFSGSEATGTFDYSDYGINYDVEMDEAEISDYITAGTLSVSKSNSTYTITFTLTDSNDNTVSGSFTGSLAYFDYSSDEEYTATNSLKSNKARKLYFR